MICPYCKTESPTFTGEKIQQVIKTIIHKTCRIRYIYCKECKQVFSTNETLYEYNRDIDINIKTPDLFDDAN
jgi:hypothetical protein